MTLKKTKLGLIGSILALGLAIAMTATTTYAWFSQNTTVSAKGMEVSVKAAGQDLLIGLDESTAQSGKLREVTFTDGVAELNPSAHTSDVKDATTASVAANWYVKEADGAGSHTSTKAAQSLTSLAGYVKVYTLYITMAAGASSGSNLKVSGTWTKPTGTAATSTLAAVKALVVSSTAAAEISSSTTSSQTVLADTISASSVEKIEVYIYYDGNDSTVYTNNFANISGAQIELSFSVTSAA